jgi:cytochrome c-type protein NapB
MRRGWILFAGIAVGSTLVAAKGPSERASHPDSSIGLSRTSPFSVPVPPAITQPASDPGDEPKFPRAYPGAPPLIPHGIAEFLPITREQNDCLECHDREQAPEFGAVSLPASHYQDLRREPDVERRSIAGARYVCLSCHVPQTDAPPLVGNRFDR